MTVGLLITFHVFRLLATGCAGSGCDWLIPVSLTLPLLIVVMAAITGLTAFASASRGQTPIFWPIVLGIATVLSVLGPIISLGVFRDSPDRFILVATVLTVLAPIAALIYTTRPTRQRR